MTHQDKWCTPRQYLLKTLEEAEDIHDPADRIRCMTKRHTLKVVLDRMAVYDILSQQTDVDGNINPVPHFTNRRRDNMYTIQGIDKDRPEQQFESVTEGLEFHRVLSIKKTKTEVRFREACDKYFKEKIPFMLNVIMIGQEPISIEMKANIRSLLSLTITLVGVEVFKSDK